MGAITHIQWTDKTFNPREGCTKVSPGCLHCYAETRNKRFAGGANWGKGAPRRRTSVHNWNEPRRWDRTASEKSQLFGNIPWAKQALNQAGDTQRPRVFCASLADWLDDEVPIQWLAEFLVLVRECKNLDWQLLTKRPENWAKRIEAEKFRRTSNLPWSAPAGTRAGVFYIPHARNTQIIIIASSGSEEIPWEHVSLRVVGYNGDRCPTWQEMCLVKDLFWDDDECIVQFHPPKAAYVNNHPHVLHLWKSINETMPRPPSIAVGIK